MISGRCASIARMVFIVVACFAVCGCINLMYTRNPLPDARINEVYQSTRIAAPASYIIAFPQTMSPSGGGGFMAANILTIPAGCVVLVDAACEAVVDTVCLPVDWPLAAHRKKIWEEHQWWHQDDGQESVEDFEPLP